MISQTMIVSRVNAALCGSVALSEERSRAASYKRL